MEASRVLPAENIQSQGKRKPRTGTQHKWSNDETEGVLNFMKDTILDNREIEKPTASAYYNGMLEKLKLGDDVSIIKLRAKVSNLKSQYLKAIDWRGKTGEGLLLSDPNAEQTVKDYIHKLCPYFELLDEIYGTKASVNPPHIHTSDEIEELDVSFESADGVEFAESIPQPPASSAASNLDSYKKMLRTEPKSWKKGLQKDSFSALTEVQAKRVKILDARVQLDEKRLEAENRWKSEEFEFEVRKFEAMHSHKRTEIRLRELEIEKDERLKILELEKDERISKYKLELEMKLQYDLAKLKN